MNTTDNSIHVLLIEDNPGDVRLIREMLQEAKGRKIVLEHCATLTQGLQALSKNDFSILLLDLTLPDSIGFDTFVKVYTQNPQIPIVVLTGTNDEELARKSVRTGAQDYLIKGQIDSSLLSRSISYAIERAGLLRVVQQELIDRKAMESMLRKINRALRVLSECNEIVVRAKEEKILVEMICGAITAVGEYQFAWVAFTVPDDGKSIQPIAISGSKNANSPEEASAWFNRDPDSPLSEALKTGKMVVCNDVTVDKRCSNLRTEADKLGYRSFVILPLVTGGKTLGVMQICSREPDRFDREELKLLEELKEDIAYAIVSIRTEKERKQAEVELRVALAKYKTLFDCFPLGITVSDEAGNILETNPTAEKLLSVPQDEQIQRDIDSPEWRIVRPDGTPMPSDEYASVRALKEKCKVENVEMGIVKPYNTITWISVTAAPLPLEGHGVVITYNDITARKLAEEKLRETNEYLESLFNYANAPIIVWDTTLVITRFNRAFEQLSGYNAEEVKGKTIDVLFSKEKIVSSLDLIKKTISGERWETVEIEIQRKSGDSRIVLWNSANILDKDGKTVVATIAQGQDITERKRAEQMLESQYTLLTALINSAHDIVIFSLDKNYCYTAFNKAHCKEMKRVWNADIKIGMNLLDCMQKPELRELAKQSIDHALLGEAFSEIQHQPDLDIYYEFNWNPIYQNKNIVGATVFIKDITERKRIEEALKINEEKLKELFESAPVGYHEIDEHGNIKAVNQTELKMLGYSYEEMEGWQAWEFTSDIEESRKRVLGKLAGNLPPNKNSEQFFTRKDGTVFPALADDVILRNEHRKITGIRTTILDITERKQSEEKNRQLQQQLIQAQKLESLGTLASGIAHDFNNILGIILAYSSLLAKIKMGSEKYSESLNAITNAVQRGAALVRQILTFARKTDILFEPMNLMDLVHELLSMLQQTFPKTIIFKENIEKDIPYIFADRTQIYQALLNLYVNARDAMPKSGCITLAIEKRTGGQIRGQFPTANQDSYLCVSVTDNGMGLDEATRSRIFDPFFTTKEKGKGTGLGLSVVFGVVQTHHGFIYVESEPGKGTTFLLYLPALQTIEPIRVEEGETIIEEKLCGTETLLVIEDEKALSELVRLLLETKGYKVHTAQDGNEAIEVYKRYKEEIDIVLTDMGLPGMVGTDVFNALREINPNVRVIFASGVIEPDAKLELSKAGAKGFIQKPYNPNEILRKLREVLDEK